MEGLSMRKSEIKKYAINYIKAITARGGDGYEEWEEYDNDFCEWCFDKWIEEQPRVDRKLFRGYKMSKSKFDRYQVGKIITCEDIYNRTYPSFTTSEMRAVIYIQDYMVYDDEEVKVLFSVECKGKYGVDISKYSYYPEETEHLFAKDASFEITEIKNKSSLKTIYLREV